MKNKSALFVVVLVVFLALSLVLGGAFVRYIHSPVIEGDETTVLVEVPEGSTFAKLMFDMHKKGQLKYPRLIIWYARLNGLTGSLKAGEYEIKKGTHARQFILQLNEGRVLKRNITFIEGTTFREMREELASAEKLKQTLNGLSDDEVMKKLGMPGVSPEGNFFPDTYQYHLGMTDEQVLRTALKKMQKTLQQEWEVRSDGLPYASPYEALTMASIVEKETGVEAERAKIAGVFVRRLQKGMLLQTDPTVIYGLGDKYDGNLRKADLQNDSRYNTYKYPGLPPTPIAMPGLDAIHAALNPDSGKSLYFVAKGDGTHEFSDSLQQHSAAVSRFQLNRSNNYHSAPTPRESGETP
ncbi:MAG TPA: endolytic transglycosylase MltG [Pseudomonadales bacterium]|nr:endolytic transglycosylase MltG [Pseudomonadales bacterium]